MEQSRSLAQQIRDARRAKKWTQEQLADAADVSVRMIQDAESGKRRPQPGNVIAIRSALGLEGDAEETRVSWPQDVQVFLDVMGAFLSAMTPQDRLTVIREITARIVGGE